LKGRYSDGVMLRRLLPLFAIGILAFGGAVSVLAQPSTRAQVREAERTKAEADRALAAAAQRRSAARTALNSIEAQLVEAAAERAKTEVEAAKAEERLVQLVGEEADATRALFGDRDKLERLLTALIVLERQKPPAIAVSPDSAADAVRAALLMAGAAPELKQRADATAGQIAILREARQSLTVERTRLATAETQLETQKARIAGLQSQATQVVAELDDEVTARTRAAARAASRLTSLRALAARVTQPRAPARVAANRPAPPRPAARVPAGAPFRALTLPTSGTLVERYGAVVAPGLTADSVTWSTRRAAQIVAPASGEVAFADAYRDYGQVLIIKASDDYAVVLTGLASLMVREGQTVRAGQPVGEMADRTSPAPRLKLQLRRGGDTIDPQPWLSR
jgi:murein hydrolase activator